MVKFNIIQITEKLPPSLHGIGDYAFKIACNIKNKYDINSFFIVFDDCNKDTDQNDDNNICNIYSLQKLDSNLSDTLIQVLQKLNNSKNIVILHYDKGFYDTYIDKEGFEKYYFTKHLRKFINLFNKNKDDGTKLIIVFHEFFPPIVERRRDYILRPIQNFLMKKVIKSADAAICSNPVVERQLKSLVPSLKIFTYPVFSNICEPTNLASKQENSWVIFGSTDNLKKTLHKFIEQIPILKSKLSIDTVNIIGGKFDPYILNLVNKLKADVPIVNYLPGISNQEASYIFSISRFCYMYYFTRNLLADSSLIFKSGVFATACSHGTIPVFGNPGMEYAIGVFNHPGFVFIKDDKFSSSNADQLLDVYDIAFKVFRWYQEYAHSSRATDIFFSVMENILKDS
ncbi:hypothetical protein B6N60_01815 [Richelia sinica FACHB-800]|uniref:Uncharacterized protein n=1 Tax=Richelia sinica FACHB-800 TaxID=1357546 RepID=A0A975T836_9NOST|nr:hypothetical protein [Richelia sinica]MBD2666132.1 hypothetical protein [Richelia sinica FACHB-800]QXE23126.1 hypothetical protein B6N60_01815 [Richelia sinica FACHB-800]